MKIVFYDNSNRIIQVIENIQEPIVEGNNISWEHGGGITGAQLPFLLLSNEIRVEGLTADQLIAADQKNLFIKKEIDLAAENEDLKKQIQSLSKDFQDFMDFFFNQP